MHTEAPAPDPPLLTFAEMTACLSVLPTIVPNMTEYAAGWHTFAASIPWFSKVTGASVEQLWHMPAVVVVAHMQSHIKRTLMTEERMFAIGRELQVLGEILAPKTASTQEA